MDWLTWCSSTCTEEIQWNQSRNCHNRKVRGTFVLNTVFLRSFLTWLTSQETPCFPSRSKLVRTSSEVTGNKLNHSVVSIILNIANFPWLSCLCQNFHDLFQKEDLLFYHDVYFGPHDVYFEPHDVYFEPHDVYFGPHDVYFGPDKNFVGK